MSRDTTHRMTFRVYSVDRNGIVTRERPEIRVTASDPLDVLGNPLNWPTCQCERTTGQPCPEQRG